MLLFGKCGIDFGSAQSYKQKHCVGPNQINKFIAKGGFENQKILIEKAFVMLPFQ